MISSFRHRKSYKILLCKCENLKKNLKEILFRESVVENLHENVVSDAY